MNAISKAIVYAAIGTALLSTQIAPAFAMGSDRSPGDTNLFEYPSRNAQPVAVQRNVVVTQPAAGTDAKTIGNATFLLLR